MYDYVALVEYLFVLYETKNREKYETGNVGYAYKVWRHGLPPFCLHVPPILCR